MKREDIVKQLVPGVIVGFILGFAITSLVGVNPSDPVPNFIGGFVCCALPTLLNGIIVLKGTAKVLKRDLSIGKALIKILPYVVVGGLFGLFVVAGVVSGIMGINTCEISVLVTAIYEAILGVIVSTFTAYLALKSYEKSVKYTRRNIKNK